MDSFDVNAWDAVRFVAAQSGVNSPCVDEQFSGPLADFTNTEVNDTSAVDAIFYSASFGFFDGLG